MFLFFEKSIMLFTTNLTGNHMNQGGKEYRNTVNTIFCRYDPAQKASALTGHIADVITSARCGALFPLETAEEDNSRDLGKRQYP